ncbi:MAG: flagellar biosynthesis protein FlhF [Spirochaetae bacterium HGW-Spirochaetae-5]|nr:MAG: flagellar biosynthesis protein FlhF [Spirochaetae bacterium HGW-Spirochaetae-5]
MKYLKITAENYNEAMKKLRMEHGDEAIPISHKYVKQGGFFNSKVFAKEVVELTAAVKERKPFQGHGQNQNQPPKKSTIDFIVDDKKEPTRLGKVQEILERASAVKDDFNVDSINKSIDTANDRLNSFKQPQIHSDFHDFSAGKEKTEVRIAEIHESVKPRNHTEAGIVTNIEREVNDIKTALNKLLEGQKQTPGTCDEDHCFTPFKEMLRANDFDPEECEIMIKDVKNSISREDQKDKYKIEKSLKDLIKSRIVTSGPIKKGNKKKIVMFIGPTGVGKTTTMAKLGAINSLREGKKVSFITIDNYRIAATEQLKKYAEIMRIPIHVISDQKHFRDVISKEKSDIIMVDTSGRSHNNELKISEIKSFADNVEYDFEKILCVSANTKKGDLKEIFKAFDVMKFDSVIITKVDETSFIGNVVDIADKYNKPISYFTDGQEVPNDIHIANSEEIADMIIRTSIE